MQINNLFSLDLNMILSEDNASGGCHGFRIGVDSRNTSPKSGRNYAKA